MRSSRSLALSVVALAVATVLSAVGAPSALGVAPSASLSAQVPRAGDAPTPIPFGGQLRNPATGRCADVRAFGTSPGTSVQLWDCNGLANQSWFYQGGQLHVYGNYNVCLAVAADVTYVEIDPCDTRVKEKWTLSADGTIHSGWNNDFCLAPSGSQAANGTRLLATRCDGAANQRWEPAFATTIPGGATIKNAASGRCMDVAGIGTALGTPVGLWDCTGAASQAWLYRDGQLHVYGNYNRCLDADGSGASPAGNGRTIGIWECHDYAGEQWTLHSDGTIRSGLDGRCLATQNDGTGNGTRLVLWDCTGASGQKWDGSAVFPPTPIAGGGPIKNPASGRCMDVAGIGTALGTQVWLWDCKGNAGQTWLYQGGQLHVYGDYDRCLDADQTGGSPAGNGRKVQIWECNPSSDGQKWSLYPDGTIRSSLDARCVSSAGDGTGNGSPLILWDCNGAPGQKWDTAVFPPISISGGGPVKNPASGRCLDVAGIGTALKTQVWLWDCVGNAGQSWLFSDHQLHVYGNYDRCLEADFGTLSPGDPTVLIQRCGRPFGLVEVYANGTIHFLGEDLCLTAQNEGTGNGTPLVAATCTGSPGQKWDLGSQTPFHAPAPPAAPTAVGGNTSAKVSWTEPSNGGSRITGYTVTASPGGQTVTVDGAQLSTTVEGLTNGTAYTFTVTATNAFGTSPPSPPSAPVTPSDDTPAGTTLTADPTWYRVRAGHRAHVTGTLTTDGVTGIGGSIQLWQGDRRVAPDVDLTGTSTDISWSATTRRFRSTGKRHVTVVYTGDDAHQGATTTVTIRVVSAGS